MLPGGLPVLGCGSPSCFGFDKQSNGFSKAMEQSDFGDLAGNEQGKDGFFRQQDAARPGYRHPEAPDNEQAVV